jgi:putative membrane protein
LKERTSVIYNHLLKYQNGLSNKGVFMKSKLIILSLLATFSIPTAYAITTTTEAANNTNQSQTQADQQKDGQVVAFLIVLNKDEVAAAKEALKKNVHPDVKKYARSLVNDHSKNLQQTLKLSHKTGQKPVENDEIANQKEKDKADLASIKPLKDKEFQVAFIDLMVKGHEAALNKIDQETPNVANPDLKKHLEATRNAIAKHLDTAKALQNNIQNAQ